MVQNDISIFAAPHLSLFKQITRYGYKPNMILKCIIMVIQNYREREKRVSYGEENQDKQFYIIGVNVGEMGLLYIMLRNLLHFAYAEKYKYIPIVDLQNYHSQFLESEDIVNKKNAWEFFFKQPAGYLLSDIQQSKNIILSSKRYVLDGYMLDNEVLINRDMQKLECLRYLYKKYIKFNDVTSKFLLADFERILKNKGRVLGVLCRGTDYLFKKPPGHPIQPEPIDVIMKAKEVMAEKQCAYLYLATEDQSIYELFKTHFGEKLLTNGQMRFNDDDIKNGQYLAEVHFDRKRDKYLLGLEYLSSINLLSKCVCFIGGITGGTLGAYVMTNGFEYDYLWNIGLYSSKDVR